MTLHMEQLPPSFKLHDKWSICIATFLGSPIAGGLLLWRNYRLVGRKKEDCNRILWMSVAGTFALLILGFLLPDWLAGIGRPLLIWGPAWLLYDIAGSGDPRHFFDTHLVRGGQRASRWVAVGVGLGVAAALLVLVIVSAVVLAPVLDGS